MFDKIATIVLTVSNLEYFFNNLRDIFLILGYILFKIYKFDITDSSKANIIKNKIIKDEYSIKLNLDNNDKPVGLIIIYIYINIKNLLMLKIYYPVYFCKINTSGFLDTKIILISTKYYKNYLISYDNPLENYIDKSLEKSSNDKKINENEIIYYQRNNVYGNIDYFITKIILKNINSNNSQKHILETISNFYKINNNGVFYIYGDIGVGKTYISYLLTHKLKGSLCDTFNPTEPSDYFHNLYTIINPTFNNPLIILLDEFDIIISDIHQNNIKKHKFYSIEINSKTSWNKFFDKFDYGHYPYVIILLCSNKDPEYFNKLDKSYIRNGRINNIFNLVKYKSI